jgi:hypothetical protein
MERINQNVTRHFLSILKLNLTTKSLEKKPFFCKMKIVTSHRGPAGGREGGTGQCNQMTKGEGGGLKSVKNVMCYLNGHFTTQFFDKFLS